MQQKQCGVHEWLVTNYINEVIFMMWNEATEFHFKKDQWTDNTWELDVESTSDWQEI